MRRESGCVAEPGLLRARRAFDPMLASLDVAPGDHALAISQPMFALATIMARDGGQGAIAAALGVDLPQGPCRCTADRIGIIGTGPAVWLAMEEGGDPLWASRLADRLSGCASVADQSSGYAVLRLRGVAACELLQRGAFIDLDPGMFGPGSAAVTTIAHMGVVLWQDDAASVFDIAMFRSHAHSFWNWMAATAAAMGIRLLRDR
jgi:sarcosine oxidase subunit gamma